MEIFLPINIENDELFPREMLGDKSPHIPPVAVIIGMSASYDKCIQDIEASD